MTRLTNIVISSYLDGVSGRCLFHGLGSVDPESIFIGAKQSEREFPFAMTSLMIGCVAAIAGIVTYCYLLVQGHTTIAFFVLGFGVLHILVGYFVEGRIVGRLRQIKGRSRADEY